MTAVALGLALEASRQVQPFGKYITWIDVLTVVDELIYNEKRNEVILIKYLDE